MKTRSELLVSLVLIGSGSLCVPACGGQTAAASGGSAGSAISDDITSSGGAAGDSTDPPCADEHQALLDTLHASNGPCETAADCRYFSAWSAPQDGEYCNAIWPIAGLPEKQIGLDELNQAFADCQIETGTAPAYGPCTRGLPPPQCVEATCVIPSVD